MMSKKKTDADDDIPIVGLGCKLYKIRNYLGLTNGEILVKINPDETDGRNRSRISEYESEDREPSLVEILNYAGLVGIRIETLLDSELKLPDEIENRPVHPRCKKRKAAAAKRKGRKAVSGRTSKKASKKPA